MFSGLRPPVAALLSLSATVYLAVLRGYRRSVVLLGLALAVLGSAASAFGTTVAVAAIAVLAAAAAGAVRRGRAVAAAHDASSRALSDTLLDNQARGERARIARELHDVVAHHISLIALQADTVRLTTPGLPADGASGLVTIADSARTALTEMRRLLGVLREDTAAEPDRRPQPSLHQLNELVDATRAAGRVAARLIVQGRVRPLSPVLELTAYRIVQEALSNSRRHAHGAAIDVDVRYGEDALRLRVRDNGPAATRTDGIPGHGLTGMRERAAMIGGTVTAGPADPVGFLVEAVLPVGDRP
jgi:signal transduction histidine kinase